MERSNLAQRIERAYSGMSKSHKRIAQYIRTNFDKAAYMTAAQLGEAVEVSESTVVRFASSLGYKGYPALQKALQETVRNKLTMLQRMEMTSEMDCGRVLKTVLRADINNLRVTLDELSEDTFEQVVDTVCTARRVYVLGARSSAPVAQFLSYYLNFILPHVHLVTSGISDLLEQLVHVNPGDVLIAISFPRYSKRTLDSVRYARDRGATVIAITDALSSPLAGFSKYVLPARSNIASFVDSLVAPFAIVNALVAAVSMKKHHETSSSFRALEEMWNQYDVYLEKDHDSL